MNNIPYILARLLVLCAIALLVMGSVTLGLAIYDGDWVMGLVTVLLALLAAACGWIAHLLEVNDEEPTHRRGY